MDSRTAVLNASPRRRRALALALPVAGLVLALGLVALAGFSLRARATLLDDRRAELGRLEAMAAAVPAGGQDAAADGDAADFLEGGSDTLVQAAFQTRFREIAEANGAEVMAVGNLPISVRGDARFAGLRASLSGSNDALVAVIFAIETSRPYLTIRSARFNSYPERRQTDGPQQLLLQLEFEGALMPGGAESGE